MLQNDELLLEAFHYAESEVNKLHLKFESENDKGAIIFALQNAYWLGATKMKTAISEKIFLEKFDKEIETSKTEEFKTRWMEKGCKIFKGLPSSVEEEINDFFYEIEDTTEILNILSMTQTNSGENYQGEEEIIVTIMYETQQIGKL